MEASGLQKFAENLEDKLRKKAVSPNTIREAFQLISAADRVVSSVSEKGRRMFSDLSTALEPNHEEEDHEGGGEDEGDPPREGASAPTEDVDPKP